MLLLNSDIVLNPWVEMYLISLFPREVILSVVFHILSHHPDSTFLQHLYLEIKESLPPSKICLLCGLWLLLDLKLVTCQMHRPYTSG